MSIFDEVENGHEFKPINEQPEQKKKKGFFYWIFNYYLNPLTYFRIAKYFVFVILGVPVVLWAALFLFLFPFAFKGRDLIAIATQYSITRTFNLEAHPKLKYFLLWIALFLGITAYFAVYCSVYYIVEFIR